MPTGIQSIGLCCNGIALYGVVTEHLQVNKFLEDFFFQSLSESHMSGWKLKCTGLVLLELRKMPGLVEVVHVPECINKHPRATILKHKVLSISTERTMCA